MTACFLSQIIYIQHERAGERASQALIWLTDVTSRKSQGNLQNPCLRSGGFRQRMPEWPHVAPNRVSQLGGGLVRPGRGHVPFLLIKNLL